MTVVQITSRDQLDTVIDELVVSREHWQPDDQLDLEQPHEASDVWVHSLIGPEDPDYRGASARIDHAGVCRTDVL